MKRINKELFLLVLAILLLIISCGSGKSDKGNGGKTLSVMIWDANQKDGVQKAIDGFMAKHPDIKVNLEVVPSDQYYTKLNAALGAKGGPDVMWQSSKAIEYVEGGVLEELDEYIKKDGVDMSKYSPLITKLYNFNGKQYGIPKDIDAWFFVYNKTLFDKYGVEYPKPDWTFEDMVNTARKLRAKMPQEEYPVYIQNDLWNGLSSMIEQEGAHVINPDGTSGLDKPEAKKAVEKAMLLLDENLMANKQKVADYNALNSLASGKIAMSSIPSWNISVLINAGLDNGSMVLSRFPSINGSFITDTNGLSYVMNKFSKNKDAAWELIKYLTSKEGSELHAKGGAGIPAYLEAQPAYIEKYKNIPGINSVEEITKNVFLRPSTQFPKARPAIQESVDQVLPKIYSKKISIEEGLKEIKTRIENKLKGN